MGRIKSGISQIGGKFRLVNRLLELTPYHEFFLSMFLGAGHFELNKPRCRYECMNDAESDIINYLVQIQEHTKEFDEMKQGVFGLVSQEICNRIVNGKIQPKNDLEKAYFFYYLNKLTFGAGIWKVRKNPPFKGIDPKGTSQDETEKIKKEFEIKTKGYAGIGNPRAIPQSTFHKEDVEKIKASFKGTNPKTTRPYTNNDCGLLTPIDSEAIKRLRYVNLTAYDFRKVYKMFYEAFHVRKGLERECFVYADEPYPGTEKYYGHLFPKELHQDLVEICLNTPFNFMLSTGGECEKIYIEPLTEAGWIIRPVKVKYATSANHQKESQEYICMNYEIKGIAKMIQDSSQKIMNEYF